MAFVLGGRAGKAAYTRGWQGKQGAGQKAPSSGTGMLRWDRGVGLLSACRWKYQIDSDIRPFDAGIWRKTCIKRLKSKLWSHRAWWCASGARAFTSCPICSPWPRCSEASYAIVMAMNGRFDYAAVGVFCAMVLDSLDGRVARMTNTQSAFGEQMDSLSDMVSFGAAPALIAYEWALKGLGRWGWIAAFVYCACAALRLARFNVNTAVVDKRYFQGLPSPAAAALVTGFIWIMTDADIRGPAVAWPMFALALYSGLTMVTNVPFYSFKDVQMKKERPVRRDRVDCAGHCGDQHPPAGRHVRRVREFTGSVVT